MTNFDNIKGQMDLFNANVKEYKRQNALFLKKIDETLKNAPDKDKGKVEEIKTLTTKVFGLAKQGKIEEAKALIKDFPNAS